MKAKLRLSCKLPLTVRMAEEQQQHDLGTVVRNSERQTVYGRQVPMPWHFMPGYITEALDLKVPGNFDVSQLSFQEFEKN